MFSKGKKEAKRAYLRSREIETQRRRCRVKRRKVK